MDISIALTIISVFVFLIVILFCSHFSARLAQLKNRSKAWGIFGFIFGIIGLIIVCYLPSKRKDNMETNPIKSIFSKVPSLSRKTAIIIIILFLAAIVTVVAYDNIPDMIENYKYKNRVTDYPNSASEQPNIISTEVSNIFSGTDSTYIISEDGKLYCFGKQLAKNISEDEKGVIYTNAKKALSNSETLFVLDTDNRLYAIGNNKNKLITTDAEAVDEFTLISNNVIDFSISETTVGIIKTNGKLYMYGDNSCGQLSTYNYEDKTEPVPVLGSVIKVICESTFTVALQKSGDAVIFGGNSYNQSGMEGKNFNSPNVIHKDIKDIAAGDDFVLLLKNNGELLSCGANNFGQLGNTTTENSTAFVTVMQNIHTISAGRKSVFALNINGELYSWGQNNVGQLGNGNTDDTSTPTLVKNNIKSVETSGAHTIVITQENDILSTGNNLNGQLGKGNSRSTFENLVSIK